MNYVLILYSATMAAEHAGYVLWKALVMIVYNYGMTVTFGHAYSNLANYKCSDSTS